MVPLVIADTANPKTAVNMTGKLSKDEEEEAEAEAEGGSGIEPKTVG